MLKKVMCAYFPLRFVVCLLLTATALPGQSVSVCETLAHIAQYRGQSIIVSGWLNINWRHGVVYLSEEEDVVPCRAATRAPAEWRGWILLKWPADVSGDESVSFSVEPGDTWATLHYHVRKSDVGISVRTVIEGELQSRPGIRIETVEGLGQQGNGYGRRGNFPAQLVIKRIVKIERPIKVY